MFSRKGLLIRSMNINEISVNTIDGEPTTLDQRIRVNGHSQHPLYAELTKTPDSEGKAGKVKWNFEKFLVAPDGKVQRFRPNIEPDAPEIISAIESSLPKD